MRLDFSEPAKKAVTSALSRISAIDSRHWIRFLLDFLSGPDSFNLAGLTEEQLLMFSMFHATVWETAVTDFRSDEAAEHLRVLRDSPVMLQELTELLRMKYETIDFIDSPNRLPYVCPLDFHCTYTRDQLLCALGFGSFSSMREGVKNLEEKKTNLLLITLNKSDRDYSPTTLYNDYAVNSTLFHWQSQSTTSADSPTGRRYVHHAETGNHILLFVREFKNDSFGTCPYTFLGEGTCVSHDGSRPMNIL